MTGVTGGSTGKIRAPHSHIMRGRGVMGMTIK